MDHRHCVAPGTAVLGLVIFFWLPVVAAAAPLVEYAQPGGLDPLPPGVASLYKTPWRANLRTRSAQEALQGIGIYYKHIPRWSLAQHTHVMQQLAACGVARLRLAPHYAIYITEAWQAPKDDELLELRYTLRACKAAGIRPCVTFVHIPPAGRAGTRELQQWWKRPWNTDLMPAGDVGSPPYQAYLDKTYAALRFLLREAKDAGFREPGSWDLELGQGLWWGAPAINRPWPSTTLRDLRPGGRFYEFGRTLIQRLRRDSALGPVVWWSYTHHLFDQASDEEVPPEAAGRSISFYNQAMGLRTAAWTDKSRDVWPVQPEMRWAEGTPPDLVLARPEGWMADRSRHDSLIALLRQSKTPVIIPSLGVVPSAIDGAKSHGLSGWQIKQRGLTRSLAFWLNQGAAFVLIHSAYEGAQDEMSHALIPHLKEVEQFRWQEAPPLATLQRFCRGLAGAKPLQQTEPLRFRCAVEPDPVILPASASGAPLRAGDAIALLPFQVDAKRFAVAAYVVTPNIAQPMTPITLTLDIDRRLREPATTLRPYTGEEGTARLVSRDRDTTTIALSIADDVTWIVFQAE